MYSLTHSIRDRDSIQHFVDEFNEDNGINWDPLSAGNCDCAECPVADPKEYFLALLNARAQQVAEEWLKLVMSSPVWREPHRPRRIYCSGILNPDRKSVV